MLIEFNLIFGDVGFVEGEKRSTEPGKTFETKAAPATNSHHLWLRAGIEASAFTFRLVKRLGSYSFMYHLLKTLQVS